MDIKTRAKAYLDFTRQWTLNYLEGIPEDKLTHQPWPGANHVLWNLGHIGASDTFGIAALKGATDLPTGPYDSIFGMGSTPVDDRSKYPPIKEVRDYVDGQRRELLALLGGMSEADLLKPTEGDMAQFAPDTAGVLFTLAWHEGVHAGQIVAIRKTLGLKPIMG
jgi:hypothetical protein